MSETDDTPMRKRVFSESRDLRKHILTKAYKSATRPGSNGTIEDVKLLHENFALRASILKVPDEHKWVLKLTEFFDSVSAAVTPRQRETQYYTIDRTLKENFDYFKPRDPNSYGVGFDTNPN